MKKIVFSAIIICCFGGGEEKPRAPQYSKVMKSAGIYLSFQTTWSQQTEATPMFAIIILVATLIGCSQNTKAPLTILDPPNGATMTADGRWYADVVMNGQLIAVLPAPAELRSQSIDHYEFVGQTDENGVTTGNWYYTYHSYVCGKNQEILMTVDLHYEQRTNEEIVPFIWHEEDGSLVLKFVANDNHGLPDLAPIQ